MADVQIKIKSTYDDQGNRKARRDLKDLKGGFDDVNLSASGFNLGVGGAAAATLLLAGAAGKGALELSKIGAESQVANDVFVNISGGSALAARNMAAMERATRGLVDATTQQQIAGKLLGLGVVQNANELERTVTVARRLGAAFKGLGAAEAAEEFSLLISNRSLLRLDSFGISATEVKKRFDELGTTFQEANEQLALDVVLDVAEKSMAQLGEETNNTLTAQAELNTAWTNFISSAGEAVEKTGLVESALNSLAAAINRTRIEAGGGTLQEELELLEKLAEGATNYAEQREIAQRGGQEGITARISELRQLIAAQEAEADAQEAANAETVTEEEETQDEIKDLKTDFARDLIGIQEDTASQLADLAKDRRQALEDAEEDTADRLADIAQDAAKERLNIEKDLNKDLARLKKGLEKDLLKQQKDEDKRIKQVVEETAKSEKRQRKLEQIDAMGDERLFQFELRRLAADGNAVAIRDALERRAIEEEIAKEKASAEKQIESEKKRDTITTIREEGQERRAQLQLDAQEREQLLKERNQEELEELNIKVAEEVAAEKLALDERKQELMEYYDERRAAIQEGEQEAIDELGRQLSQMEELTTTQFGELVGIAKRFGEDFGKEFAQGLGAGFAENTAIGELIGSPVGARSPFANNPIPGDPAGHFQGGGVVDAPPGQAVPAILHGQEVVANPNEGQAITIGGETFAVHQAQRMAGAINKHVNYLLQLYTDELSEAL